jgi:hypothetical protein
MLHASKFGRSELRTYGCASTRRAFASGPNANIIIIIIAVRRTQLHALARTCTHCRPHCSAQTTSPASPSSPLPVGPVRHPSRVYDPTPAASPADPTSAHPASLLPAPPPACSRGAAAAPHQVHGLQLDARAVVTDPHQFRPQRHVQHVAALDVLQAIVVRTCVESRVRQPSTYSNQRRRPGGKDMLCCGSRTHPPAAAPPHASGFQP